MLEFPQTVPCLRQDSFRALHDALRAILSEYPIRVRDRERNALQQTLSRSDNRCVLFGAGSVGERAVVALSSIGVRPLAVSDNNPGLWGTSIKGVPVLSPEAAAAQFGSDAVFFITIRNQQHWFAETLGQLTKLGCSRISSCDAIGWRFPELFLPFLLYDLPHKVYTQAACVLQAAEIWADDASRAEYLAQVRLRALGDPSGLSQPAENESYLLQDVFALRPEDSFLDCGAFDGDTIRDVIAHQPAVRAIAAVEADESSFGRLQNYVTTLTPWQRERISLHSCAVGAHRGTVQFEKSGKVTSKISDSGDSMVDLVPIDELCGSMPISMIKMDIEGAEYDALLGAKRVIQRDRPILAICVYHLQQDLWRIPLLLRSFSSDYQMYLRSDGGDGLQTVVYAVPPERVLVGR